MAMTDDKALTWALYERANARSQMDYQLRTGQMRLPYPSRKGQGRIKREQKEAAAQQK